MFPQHAAEPLVRRRHDPAQFLAVFLALGRPDGMRLCDEDQGGVVVGFGEVRHEDLGDAAQGLGAREEADAAGVGAEVVVCGVSVSD